ncbi:MAG TPA: M23 family metallopeptidase [Ignavibacteria bacterium]|nr:M23 family metallopeptidase [Ignavibacteria bacterium]
MLKFLILLVFFSPFFVYSQTNPTDNNIGDKWDALDKKIIFLEVEKEDGAKLLEEYEKELVKYFMDQGGRYVLREDWVFPLKNFTSVTHREEGNDYRESTYDYFQGSNTKGHPAHDIFILDSDKDLLDDSTGKPVDVVSMSSGVVVAVDTTWYVGSYLRGGQYVKIFDVTNYKFFYYSHLSVVSVVPGDIVNAGDKIGEVGRTGRKTILPQGKTHLHVALLKSVKGYPYPEPIIDDIWRSKEKYLKGN